MAWAPDSSAVAFYLDVAVRFVDSDVYLYEIADRTVVNLTDDGFEGSLLDAEDVPGDLVPTWSPDSSELAFARSTVTEEGGTTLMRVSRDGGEATEIVTVPGDEQLAVWTAMYWLADDTIVFSVLGPDPDNPANGIWRVGADGSGLRAGPRRHPRGGHPTTDGGRRDRRRGHGVRDVDQPSYWGIVPATGRVLDRRPGDLGGRAAARLSGAGRRAGRLHADRVAEGTVAHGPGGILPDGELALVAYRPLDDAPVSFKVLDVATGVTAPVTAPPRSSWRRHS